ncbi:hypothetical protein chiPu_0013860 [Chiloscyllium punctatum]|uniref:Uncharacterized protein n=1 Tax=Chiloscyllium punctatum TaxID=137246 RepID=A0A401SYA0_CHIPU|nr:hypothetical protein [Chiloscyllium punctatum]
MFAGRTTHVVTVPGCYQRNLVNFLFFMLILLLTSYAATSLAMAVSAGLDTMTTAGVVINGIFVFAMALQVNEFRNLYFCNHEQRNDTILSQAVANCSGNLSPSKGICYGEEYLCGQGSGFDLWAIWKNVIALACITIIFLIVAYINLRCMRKFT